MCDLYLNQSVHLTGAQAHLVFFDSACFLLDGADDCIVGWGLGACPIAILVAKPYKTQWILCHLIWCHIKEHIL